ncbi:MAG: transposase [Planctomycetes bacterium]|nr:transposase [Planctomycetota bacterium]
MSQCTGARRAERALAAALDESYIQSVSNRRMLRITEELCDSQVSSSQVFRIKSELDEQLGAFNPRTPMSA